MNVDELYSLIDNRMLITPSYGSGKYGKLIKIDLINTLKYSDSKIYNKNYNKLITEEMIFSEFDKLPPDMIMKIAYKLSPRKVTEYCSLSKRFAKICDKEYFWIKKYQLDFSDYAKNATIKEKYKFRMKQDPKLRNLLIDYADFDKLNYQNQIKIYTDVLQQFKDLPEDISMLERGDEDDIYEVQSLLTDIFYGLKLDDVSKKYDIVIDYDMFNGDNLINRLLDVYNSIMKTDYTF